ncbi:MAG: hypothetical protein WAZ48_14410 [Lysobacteraceae bacterium]
MDSAYQFLLFVHGLSGLVALITFWIAASAKKGSPLHVRVGKTYMIAMLGIIATAVPMAVIIGMRGNSGVASFLAYLVVITASSMWLGRRAIRRKRDQTAMRDGVYPAVAALNLVASVVVFAIGWKTSEVLLMGFSVVGFLTGGQMLVRRMRPLAMTRWWMKEHIAAMVGCGVATHIAFLSIGINRVIDMLGLHAPDGFGLVAWMAPLAVATVAGFRLNRKYVPKERVDVAVATRS